MIASYAKEVHGPHQQQHSPKYADVPCDLSNHKRAAKREVERQCRGAHPVLRAHALRAYRAHVGLHTERVKIRTSFPLALKQTTAMVVAPGPSRSHRTAVAPAPGCGSRHGTDVRCSGRQTLSLIASAQSAPRQPIFSRAKEANASPMLAPNRCL